MKFYSNVHTQGNQCGTCVKHIDDIHTTSGIIPTGLPPNTQNAITSALHSEFQCECVIHKDFTVGQNLLMTTTDGHKFLVQLLMIAHPKFVDITTAIAEIPKCSETSDLCTHAHQLTQCIELQTINKCHCTDEEISSMCPHHLDDPSFANAVTAMQTRIERFSPSSLPLNLTVPALATIIDQQIQSLTSSNNTAPTAQASHLSDHSSLTESNKTESNSFCNVANYVGQGSLKNNRPPHAQSNSKPQPNCQQSGNFPRRLTPFKGNCCVCGQRNHDTRDSTFFWKLQSCQQCLQQNPNCTKNAANCYRNNRQCATRRDKVQMLQDDDFIDSQCNLDSFLDIVDNLVINDLLISDDASQE